MSHGGGKGFRKGPKKCHVLFEWSLYYTKTESSQTESLNCKGKVFFIDFCNENDNLKENFYDWISSDLKLVGNQMLSLK